jgi:RNA polymerase sigma-70 factor (ECF subfamily)
MPDASPTTVAQSTHDPVVAGPAVDPEERELVAAVIRKDRKATAELVGRFADAIHAYVRQRLAPRAEMVDDLVQEVFLAALKGLPSFAGRSSLKVWLLGIARHKVEDHYRAHLRRAETLSDFDDDSAFVPVEQPRFDELIDDERVRDKTRRVLARLPEAYGYALLWRYWERRSVREIAAQTGRTEKAGERLLARARTQFKRLWEVD